MHRRAAAENRKREEEEVAASVAGTVQERVEAAMQSPEVQARIEQRLREERSRLEQQVDVQLTALVPHSVYVILEQYVLRCGKRLQLVLVVE